jgi:excisionase family DNA binding protein
MHANAIDQTPRLTTIEDAIRPYCGLSVAMLRAWIRRGKLPATRAGKGYLIDPRDLADLLRPTLRPSPAHRARESESARIERQLAQAGVR